MMSDREFATPVKPSLGQIPPGADVCDVSGEKVGTVARVHHAMESDQVIEVKTGLFGLGKHLYVTTDQINSLTDGGVILKHPKQDFHTFGLDARPEHMPG